MTLVMQGQIFIWDFFAFICLFWCAESEYRVFSAQNRPKPGVLTSWRCAVDGTWKSMLKEKIFTKRFKTGHFVCLGVFRGPKADGIIRFARGVRFYSEVGFTPIKHFQKFLQIKVSFASSWEAVMGLDRRKISRRIRWKCQKGGIGHTFRPKPAKNCHREIFA